MSENISILEGGQAKVFGHVQKLKISNSGGGSSLWVPEEAVPTGSLYVDKNGTYYASNEGYFGYDEVEVNIVKSVKGKKNNKPYDVTVDDDGFLHENELPAYIEITTPPTTLNYVDGQDISTEGWVVKAFYTDGTEWGDISDTAMIDPAVADITKVGGDTADSSLLSQYSHVVKRPFPMGLPKGDSRYYRNYTFEYEGDAITGYHNTNGISYDIATGAIVASKTENGGWVRYRYGTGGNINYGDKHYTGYSFTHGGKTVYYTNSGLQNAPALDIDAIKSEFQGHFSADVMRAIAWTMLYGDITPGGQKITVNWDREDGEVLSTSFTISVGAGPIPPSP